MKLLLTLLLLSSCSLKPTHERPPQVENYKFKLQHMTEMCVIKLTNAGVSQKLISQTCIKKNEEENENNK